MAEGYLKEDAISKIKRELLVEQQKNSWLTKELDRMKHAAAELSQAIEAEEVT